MAPHLRKHVLRKGLTLLCLLSFTLCLWLGSPQLAHRDTVQATDPQTLVETGVEQYQAGEFQVAIATWQQALTLIAPDNRGHQSIIFENLARAHHQLGLISEEITYWEQAIEHHQHLNDLSALGRALTEQAQAYTRLGQYRRSLAILCGEDLTACNSGSALQIARAITDSQGEAAALGSLGETYRLTGEYAPAIEVLEKSLAIIETDLLTHPTYQAAVLNSLGDTYAALATVNTRRALTAAERGDSARQLAEKANDHRAKAIEYLTHSNDLAQTNGARSLQVRSQLSLIRLYQQSNQAETASQTWEATKQLVRTLPDSQEKVFATLSLASYLDPQSQTNQCPAPPIFNQQIQLLETAIATAETIQNSRSESFALGQLGNLYERCEDYEQALTLTQNARLAADQDRSAKDSLYLWAWQQGRILKVQGKTEAAAKAYSQAIEILDTLRSEILNANQELQFDFRDQVEPLYREFATLKLTDVPVSVPIEDDGQAKVDSVLVTLDSLKLAELQNYFANDCVIVPVATRVDVVGKQSATAVISTAIFENQTAVIASFPDGKRQVEWLNIEDHALRKEINAFRYNIEQGRFRPNSYKTQAIKLYDQLIRPFESSLENLQVNTLVFINDGIFRSIPMAVLHDGQQFLIEKYAIATTPSLTLTDPNSLATDRQNLSALILGLSEASQVRDLRFGALQKVEEEISSVKKQFPNSTLLKNSDFSEEKLQQALQENSYRILHIATHGSFGAEPEDNYIVTGEKIDETNNKTLTISELDALIRQVSSIDQDPIDLLTLTACETAVGDDRATLGLAGVAVRAGARSAIASLWAVDDDATATLITRFYHHLLDPNLSKAEALRAAQLEVIQQGGFFANRPYYWAPFILIGNWL